MASTLRSKAIKNVTKGNTSAYYSYVEERNGVNPVNQQFEKELNDYMGFIKKKNSGLLKPGEHAPCKVSDVLFDIWNKFEPRVTPRLFYQKLMQIGEYLVENKEYSTASWQCYDRYLNSISDVDFDGIQSVEALKSHFFPNGIDIQENSDMTFRALMGHLICKFHLIVNHDQKLQSANSVLEVAKIMHNLRMVMQLLFEVEHFCWLIYNATIYMYTIGRFMMQYGQSKIVLEYLIFCSLSMECSVALLSSKYLPWRATLYVATCQCYYDCRYYDDGEIFARRALSKINELHELEMASIAGQKGVDIPQFREATIKIGVVLFKRLVYESRRKSKGVYRPKNKLAYKDINNLTWPRTGVEKILNEMFDCSSAQFLAVQEALSDSNRRIAMPGVSGNENENDMFDVNLELLFAAEYLVNGGGGKSPLPNDQLSDFSALVTDNSSILSIAIQGNNGVHIKNYLKIVKFAFNYEAWDVFRRMSLKIIDFIENDPKLFETYKSDLLIIYLLQGADKYHTHLRKLRQIKNEQLKATLVAAKEKSKKDAKNEDFNGKNSNVGVEEKSQESKGKKSRSNLKTQSQQNLKVDFAENSKDNETNDQDIASSPGGAELYKEEDMLFNIAYKLILIIDSNIHPEETDYDVAVDITLLLWKKCKEIFQKYQTGSHDNYRWVTKLENFSKWLYILNVTHESMCYFNISSIDPAVFGHCSLRLGLTYESLANINFKRFTKDSSSQFEVQTYDDQYSAAKTNLTKLNFEFSEISSERFGVSNDIRGNLIKAKYVLKKALMAISLARATVSKTDKSCLCDKDYTLDFVELGLKTNVKASTNTRKIEKLKNLKEKTFSFQKNIEVDSVTKLIGDLHVELIFLYHKISVRLLQHRDFPIKGEKLLALIDQDFEVLFKECKKNKISQSLLFLSKALSLTHFHLTDQNKLKTEQRNLIQKAYDRLKKAEIEDEILFKKHVQIDADSSVKTKIPPAPIVCLKTFNKIVVQPRKFECTDGTKASWYRVFAGLASNVNLKARISDYGFIGSGEQIPAKTSEKVSISGLSPDEQYIFAVAAYDRNGLLIADSIGESTDPMLASSTLSILMNWAYLCQVSYQIGDYEMSLSAFKILWNLFVIKPIEPAKETVIIQNQPDYEVSFH
ncbi:cilia- and flagella-associated 54, partial [Brachionus plicatilis]